MLLQPTSLAHIIILHVASLTPNADELSLADWWTRARKHVHRNSRKAFDSLVILVMWSLWLERNARTFDRRERCTTHLVADIQEEAKNWVDARYVNLALLGNDQHHDSLGAYAGRTDSAV